MRKMRWAIFGSMLVAVGSFTACKKLPATENLSSNFVVLTNYDTAANFASYRTFAIRDSIAISTGNPKDSLWYDGNAQKIIGETVTQMTRAGYTQVALTGHPDLGIQLTAVRDKVIYGVGPGYWWGQPGYVDPCYWGNCWPYWYPYYYSYSIRTGTLMVEMADLLNAGKNKKLDIIWTGIGSGQIGNSQSFILDQCIRSIDQAFAQSPFMLMQK